MILIDLPMPQGCSACYFSDRMDNAHTICNLFPLELPREDWQKRPEWCPIKGTSDWDGGEE